MPKYCWFHFFPDTVYSDNKWRMLKVTLQVAIQGRSLRYMTALFSDVV